LCVTNISPTGSATPVVRMGEAAGGMLCGADNEAVAILLHFGVGHGVEVATISGREPAHRDPIHQRLAPS